MKKKQTTKIATLRVVLAALLLLAALGSVAPNQASAATSVTPSESEAAPSTATTGLVPCGNGNSPDDRCTLCHLVLGFKGIIDYGFRIFIFLAVLMLVVGGIMYIVSAGDQGLIGTAKGVLKNTLFGFTFVLTGWLLVNFTIMLLGANVGVDTTGRTWDKFTCDSTPDAMTGTGTTGASSQ